MRLLLSCWGLCGQMSWRSACLIGLSLVGSARFIVTHAPLSVGICFRVRPFEWTFFLVLFVNTNALGPRWRSGVKESWRCEVRFLSEKRIHSPEELALLIQRG